MRFSRVVIGVALVLSCALGTADVQTQSASPTISPELRAQLEASIQRGVAYLMKNQKPDGSWEDYLGIHGAGRNCHSQAAGQRLQDAQPRGQEGPHLPGAHGEA
ncbi:MAG: hypothetical protein MZW92_53300 [Comamonadaceae bacterium]|nr:hypothetical protein [Comamonadaceae bacterium]